MSLRGSSIIISVYIYMVSSTKSKLSTLYFGALAALLALVSYVPSASAATSYDFSSSTAEASALTTAMAGSVTTLFLTAFAVISGIALTLMGIAWIWSRFKKYTGIGKKI